MAAPTATTFTTRTGADLTAPLLQSTVPANGATNILRNIVAQLVFNERLSAAAVDAETVVFIDQTSGQSESTGQSRSVRTLVR